MSVRNGQRRTASASGALALRQRGVSLLESLIAIFIFSIGVLGLLAASATATATSGDAQYRLEASNHAQEILQQIWATATRDAKGAVPAGALDGYNFDSASTRCSSASGGNSGENSGGEYSHHDLNSSQSTSPACGWFNSLKADHTGLPGVQAAVAVDNSSGAHNRVTVTISWITPGGSRRYQVVGYVN